MSEVWSGERTAIGRRGWRLTLIGTLVSALGTGLTLPFLFVYLHGVRHLTLPLAGTIVATGAIAVFALTPVSGIVGDRFGLGRLLVIGLVANAAGTALLALPAGAVGPFVAVALSAAGNSLTFPALNGMVASQLPSARRSRAYALRFAGAERRHRHRRADLGVLHLAGASDHVPARLPARRCDDCLLRGDRALRDAAHAGVRSGRVG